MGSITRERFWAKVDRRGSDECWEWKAARDENGYGRFGVAEGDVRLPHRISYELSEGPIPKGLCVLHDCDNPPCVNPSHLHLGTRSDNHREMVERERLSHGEDHPDSELTESEVVEIRERYVSEGVTQQELADEYGVIRQAVGRIVRGDNWSRAAGPLSTFSMEGDDHPNAVLTDGEVVEIREKYDSGQASQRELAEEYGLSDRSVVSHLVRGKRRTAAGGPVVE